MFYWSNLNIKDMLARMRRNQDPEQGVTWEVPGDAGGDYLAQMDSEARQKIKGKWIWKKIGKRPNHLWDCECMQLVAALMMRIIGRESVEKDSAEEKDEKNLLMIRHCVRIL